MVRFNRTRFTSQENEQWYEERAEQKLLIEKMICPTIEEQFHLKAAFNMLHWHPIVELDGDYYPALVRQFYANIEDKHIGTLRMVRTFVKGVHIEVTEEYLARLLGVPNDGTRFMQHKRGSVTSDPAYTPDEAKAYFGLHNRPTGRRKVLKVKYLPIWARLLAFLIGSNVTPRSKATDEFCHCDMYFVYRMLNRLGELLGIPLASIIISHMRKCVAYDSDDKTLSYPVLISRIIEDKGVRLQHEDRLSTTISDMITSSTMTTLLYEKHHGVWFNPHLQEDPLPAADPPGHEPIDDDVHPQQEAGPSTAPAPPPPGPIPDYIQSLFDLCRDTQERMDLGFRQTNLSFQQMGVNYEASQRQMDEILHQQAQLQQQQVQIQHQLATQQQQLDNQGDLLDRLWRHFHPDD